MVRRSVDTAAAPGARSCKRKGCRWAVGAIASFLVAPPGHAFAEASRSVADVVEVVPGATCLNSATLADHIRAWLGSDELPPEVSVVVEGSPDDRRVVRFQAFRGKALIATRQFDPGPESCEHLHAAVGLAIAMAVGPSLVGELLGLEGAAPAPESTAKDIPPRWTVGASAVASTNLFAQLALGADATVQRTLSPGFALQGGLLFQGASPGHFQGGTYDIELLVGHVDACAGAGSWQGLRVQGCVAFQGGAIFARGHSFTVSETATKPWFGAANRLEAVVALGDRWSLDFSVGVTFPLERMDLVVRDPSGATLKTQELDPVGELAGVGAIYHL